MNDIAFGNGHDFVTHLGCRLEHWAEGECVVSLELKPHFLNMSGFLHGGIIMSLLDITCGRAGCWVPKGEPARYSATVSFSSNFLRGCRVGPVRSSARRLPGGSRIFSSTGEVRDAEGTLLAVGQGAFSIRNSSAPNHRPAA